MANSWNVSAQPGGKAAAADTERWPFGYMQFCLGHVVCQW